MREALLVAFVALAFGLAAQQIQPGRSLFVVVHLGVAALAFALAVALGLRRTRALRSIWGHSQLLRPALGVLGLLLALVIAEAAALRSALQLDLTFERRYELADATRHALEQLGPQARLTLYADAHDPRARSALLLLERMGSVAGARVRSLVLDEAVDDIDRFGIGNSNTVVVERGRDPRDPGYDWQLVSRPTEGALFEALSQLADTSPHPSTPASAPVKATWNASMPRATRGSPPRCATRATTCNRCRWPSSARFRPTPRRCSSSHRSGRCRPARSTPCAATSRTADTSSRCSSPDATAASKTCSRSTACARPTPASSIRRPRISTRRHRASRRSPSTTPTTRAHAASTATA